MANIENCQQILRIVMMVTTYSASVLLNVVGGEPEGNSFFHLGQLQNGFSSCCNGTFGHSTAFVDFSWYHLWLDCHSAFLSGDERI